MRNYRREYKTYQGSDAQKKRRASRNAARAKMIKLGKVKKGDGKDVAHKNGNPRDNRAKNLKVSSTKSNRSFPRTRTAGKRNKRD